VVVVTLASEIELWASANYGGTSLIAVVVELANRFALRSKRKRLQTSVKRSSRCL
jgi:hypothetical protein